LCILLYIFCRIFSIPAEFTLIKYLFLFKVSFYSHVLNWDGYLGSIHAVIPATSVRSVSVTCLCYRRLFRFLARRPLVGQGRLTVEISRSHSDTPHSADSFGRVSNNTHTRQTSMPAEGFEPAFPASERPQTYVLARAATGLGSNIPAFDSEILGTQICLLFFTQTSCNPDGNPVTFSLRQFMYLSLKLLFVTCDCHLETHILVSGTRFLEILVFERIVAMQ